MAIWDLTEPSFHHEAAQIGNNMLTFQNVTFTTGFFTIFHFYIFLVADVANGNPFFFLLLVIVLCQSNSSGYFGQARNV